MIQLTSQKINKISLKIKTCQRIKRTVISWFAFNEQANKKIDIRTNIQETWVLNRKVSKRN